MTLINWPGSRGLDEATVPPRGSPTPTLIALRLPNADTDRTAKSIQRRRKTALCAQRKVCKRFEHHVNQQYLTTSQRSYFTAASILFSPPAFLYWSFYMGHFKKPATGDFFPCTNFCFLVEYSNYRSHYSKPFFFFFCIIYQRY